MKSRGHLDDKLPGIESVLKRVQEEVQRLGACAGVAGAHLVAVIPALCDAGGVGVGQPAEPVVVGAEGDVDAAQLGLCRRVLRLHKRAGQAPASSVAPAAEQGQCACHGQEACGAQQRTSRDSLRCLVHERSSPASSFTCGAR